MRVRIIVTFKAENQKRLVGAKDLELVVNLSGLQRDRTKEINGEGIGDETNYIRSDDVGCYDLDSNGELVCRKNRKIFFNECSVKPRFEIGMIFESPNQFKEALAAYVVHHRYDFKLARNEKFRTRAKWKAQWCLWMIHIAKDNEDRCFKVKTFDSEHTCSIIFKNKRTNYKFIRKHFLSKSKIIPRLKLFEMQRLAKGELKVELNKNVYQRARSWAI
ncbi:hypothetical protein PVK06_012381 [Gossypium arboreum]|uniref:Transposase MuDR plant domain-containing protein n=1 Tax=Gossypium arboreum TaxID=29729 RepID=A0ABR0QCB1_GOSAR|nr:hypothetical protein PVK06_012381 [Gossypium arboreum]